MMSKYTSDHVEKLIKELIPLVDEIETFSQAGLVLYGAGFVGTWAGQYLQSQGVMVDCFIDRDPKKLDSTIHGIPVFMPDESVLDKVSAMLISSRHVVKDVQAKMNKYGFPMMSFDGYFVVKNYQRLITVRDEYLADDKSVETFNAILISMLTSELSSCLDVMEKDMYFGLPEFSGNFDETFVDAGAFVGDTVERFIWENLGTFKHIYAFEPGYKQFNAMQKRLQRLADEWAFPSESVSLIKAGLSSSSGRMSCTFVDDSPLRHGLSNSGDGENSEDERFSSEICTLDSYLNERSITFLKADVEGMEMPLLEGAQETIKRDKPKMALCVYHYPCDLYSIPEYVRQLVPEYKFHLRQHAPIFGDFVLYCHVE